MPVAMWIIAFSVQLSIFILAQLAGMQAVGG
jgi:hypothetical protein